MNRLINLEKITDYEMYNPILTLCEDLDFDNNFYVLSTKAGNIAFSYYDLGITPNFIIQDTILFLSFGNGYYIVDLKEKNIISQTNDIVIFQVIKSNVQSLIMFIGEMCLICFSLEGKLMWKNSYRNTIFDWSIKDEGLSIIFENNEKWLIYFKDGNGIPIV